MMWPILKITVAACAALLMGAAQAQTPPASGPRLALVIGDGAYANAPQAPQTTAVNDAGLIAYQLQQAGFDVTGGRDVDRQGFETLAATFLAKLAQGGPNAVAVVYVAGLGLQADGDNRIVPTDAHLTTLDAIGPETISVNALLAQIQSVPGAAHVAIFDMSRQLPFPIAAQVAPGLTPLDPQAGLLVAFAQQPGYLIEEQKQGYGAYASALAEAIREPGLSLDDLFGRVRLRVQTITRGGQMPWNVSGLSTSFTFFTPQTPVAPPPAMVSLRNRPIAEMSIEDAFAYVIERDSIADYEQFIAAFPDGLLTRRARAIVAARREAFYWQRTVTRDTPEAYWTYLRHYPRGPHAGEARYRLSLLNAPYNAPATFYDEPYDVPAPLPQEVADAFVPFDRWYSLPPPPPPPVIFLPPPVVEFYQLPPPPPAPPGFLPAPPRPIPPPPQIVAIPVPAPLPLLGKPAPLPLAVAPTPTVFAPGKAPPGVAQPAAATFGAAGQFKPVGPGGPVTPPKGPAAPTPAPTPVVTPVAKPPSPAAPLPLPVPPGAPLPKVSPGPGVAPAPTTAPASAPAGKPGAPLAPLPLPLPAGAPPSTLRPAPGVAPAPVVAPAPGAKPGTPQPLPAPTGSPAPTASPAPTLAPAPLGKPASPMAPQPLPQPASAPPKAPPATVAPAPAVKPVTPQPIQPASRPLPASPPPSVVKTPVPPPSPAVAKPAPPPQPAIRPAAPPPPVARPVPPPPPVARPVPPPPPVARPVPPPPPTARPAQPPPPRPGPKKPCTPEEHAKGLC
jgi:uncharacterized caspase-like protein